MSLYHQHVKAGWKAALWVSPLAVAWLVYKYIRLERFSLGDIAVQIGTALLSAYIMSIFPDIDIRSKARTRILLIVSAVSLLLFVFNYHIVALALLVVFFGIALFPPHRGFTHSVGMAFLVPVIFMLLPVIYGDGFRDIGIPAYIVGVASYLSHLKLD